MNKTKEDSCSELEARIANIKSKLLAISERNKYVEAENEVGNECYEAHLHPDTYIHFNVGYSHYNQHD